jgi:hypothetical protein
MRVTVSGAMWINRRRQASRGSAGLQLQDALREADVVVLASRVIETRSLIGAAGWQ